MIEIIVGKNESGQRLDRVLEKIFVNANTGFIFKMLRKKNITLNDKKAEAITLDAYTILKRKEISISALIEELEHTEQYLRNENDGSALSVAINELNAKRKSIEEQSRYKLPKMEVERVKKDIKYYEKEVRRLKNENSKF